MGLSATYFLIVVLVPLRLYRVICISPKIKGTSNQEAKANVSDSDSDSFRFRKNIDHPYWHAAAGQASPGLRASVQAERNSVAAQK